MVIKNSHKLSERKIFFILGFVLIPALCLVDSVRAGNLSEDTGISLTGVYQSAVVWGDIDNDGDLDLVLAGFDSSDVRYSKIYENSGSPQHNLVFSQSLTGVSYSSLTWGDYDRDGDLDLALSGQTEAAPGRFTKIYRNDGGILTDSGIELIPVWAGSLAWGDYDNDGDLDLALTGWNNIVTPYNHSKIYRNDAGTFVEDTSQNLIGVQRSSIAWADYDNDGDLDIVLTGWDGSERISKIYKNSGGPGYKLSESQTLTAVDYGSVAWGDYDNDGDLDLALCGDDGTNKRFLIYNNNDGTLDTTNPIEPMGGNQGVIYGSLGWGDADNDGDLDLAICGYDGANERFLIYKYDGGTSFTLDQEPMGTNKGVQKGSLAWADLDMDADLDLVLTGHDGSGAVSKIFENDESQSGLNGKNIVPTPPTSLVCNYADGKLTLIWSDGADNATTSSGKKTPASGLYYNIRVGSERGADDLIAARYGTPLLGSFLSKKKSGGQNTLTFRVYGKGYYWSVQTIDTTLGFSWSDEGTESGWSEETHYNDTSPPPAPETPTDEGQYTYNTTVRFSWTQNNPDPETAIYNYWLQVRSREDGKLKFDGNVGDVKSYSVSGCEYNKTYEAHLKSQSGGGYSSDWSDWSDGIKVVRLLDITNNLIHPKEAGDKTSTIKYYVINPGKVSLKIYNLMGELVKVLVDNENREPKMYEEPWSGENDNGSTVASGIYLVHIEVAGENATEKICVVK